MKRTPESDEVNAVIARNSKRKAEIEATFYSASPKRNFYKSEVTGYGYSSLAGASIQNLVKVLKPDQMKQCGITYINNGVVRTVVDRSIFFINPERTDFVAEANEELVRGATEKEVKEIEDSITDNTITFENKTVDVKGLEQKAVRANKRCKLHDRTDKILASALIYGLGALKIERFSKTESPDWGGTFGEPKALRHLSSLRIKDIFANKTTGEFEGFNYDEGSGSTNDIKKFKSTDLVPAFHDDYNIVDNSNFSGISAVWGILEAANVIEALLSEDLPEVTRQSHSKFGVIYAGTNKKAVLNRIREALEAGTWLVHGEQALEADVHDLSIQPVQLMELCGYLSKYITTGMNLPLFMLFEDSANFATASQVMQVYRAGILTRYRTWLQNILEDYWYAPIIADHLGIEIDEVIRAPIKLKPTFKDISFETRSERVTTNKTLQDMLVYKPSDSARDIHEDKIANRLKFEETELDEAIATQKLQSIQLEKQIADTAATAAKNKGGGQPFGGPRKQSKVPSKSK